MAQSIKKMLDSPIKESGSATGFGELELRLKLAEEENARLRREKAHLEELVKGLMDSLSWRLTKPLRDVMALKRQLFPLWRSRQFRLKLQPGRNVAAHGNGFSVSGPSPTLLVEPTQGNRMPQGWVRVRATLRSCPSHAFFFLYYSEQEGRFDEAHRHLLTLEADREAQVYLKLSKLVQSLRLDPFISEGEFELPFLDVTEVGTFQVAGSILAKHLRQLIIQPKSFFPKLRKLLCVLRAGGLTALKVRLFANQSTNNYQDWVERYDLLGDRERSRIRAAIERLEYKPLISVLMPTYNTPEAWLRRAIESVRCQLYPNWELCIADDASPNGNVRSIIEEYAAQDSRIHSVFRAHNGHISAASNSALELASGEYVALLDHDDELSEHALYMVAEELNRHPHAVLLYSDEDKLTGYGMRFNPHFKSGWNPDLLLSQNYVCHLTVVRAQEIRAIGGFRPGFEGAQDWDLVLRVSEQIDPSQIRHIPHVLYHWRVIEGSTAQSTAYKPYVLEAQARAVSEHLERKGVLGAKVEILHDISHLRVRRPLPASRPLVSLIIPTRNMASLLRRTICSIEQRTDYRDYEIIVVDNGSHESEALEFFEELTRHKRALVVRDERPFNFSALNNNAVLHARGELIGFLNNDLEVIEKEWLSEMVSHAVRTEVGGVGARLLYPNGQIQHAGIILGIGGIAGHSHKGKSCHDPGYFNRAILCHDFSAVTAACMIMRRGVFEQIEGFDESLSVAFNDVDLCLRIRSKGYLLVYTPYAVLYHYESASRGYENTPEKFLRFEGEIEKMKRKWGSHLASDPYYNPNLTLLAEDFGFAFPPRAERPWQHRPEA